MSDSRPIVYFDSSVNRWVYRASAIGRPIRCLVSARQGYTAMDPPKYLTIAAEAGNQAEIIVKAMLRAQGYRISGEQGESDVGIGTTAMIRGHMDAQHCVDLEGVDRVLEVKSMSQRVWDEWWSSGWEAFPEYAAQLTYYMHVMSFRRNQPVEALYAVYNRSNPGQLQTMVVKTPPMNFEDIRAKILEVEKWGETNELPPCTGAKYACGYDYICDRNEMRFEELEEGSKAVLMELTERYSDLLDGEEDIKAQKEEVRKEVLVAMGTREKAEVPGWSISITTPKPKRTLSVEKLRVKLGDELDKFWVEEERKPTLYLRRKST